jgi:hypothetical protein
MKQLIIGTSAILGLIGLAVMPSAASADAVYVAHLQPLNSNVTGLQTQGEARFTIKGDSLTIDINVEHAPADMMHLEHFHGFKDGRAAACPTAENDKDGDGIIDLIETESVSGTTMVPFHDDPVSMQIVNNTYPKADAEGSYHYEKTVSLAALKDAFGKAFGGQDLDLDKRVVYIHGIPDHAPLPKTVASLGTIPAQITIPIACGKIERAP